MLLGRLQLQPHFYNFYLSEVRSLEVFPRFPKEEYFLQRLFHTIRAHQLFSSFSEILAFRFDKFTSTLPQHLC